MKKIDVINHILKDRLNTKPKNTKGLAFAPTNIALIKYWGKSNLELNLPVTSSLSVTLPSKGAMTELTLVEAAHDNVILNNELLSRESDFVKRLVTYLDLFRSKEPWYLNIDIKMDIPVAAGLASSACGFASFISALNDLCAWQLSLKELSILARLGSGSACRSFWQGFVEWKQGTMPDGSDSYAEPIDLTWFDFRVGLLTLEKAQKPISSSQAMQRTVDTSVLYQSWPKKVSQDLNLLKQALLNKNFSLVAGTAESNALSMHATMLSAWPPICYFSQETIGMMKRIWQARHDGLQIYFTEDAGPNLKLLFLRKDEAEVKQLFPTVEVVKIFED